MRELLRILKLGGLMYLGYNVEKIECKLIDKFVKIFLFGCYWLEICLKNRIDVVLIYYIKEKDLFGVYV